MRPATLFDHPPLAMPVEVQGYHIDLELHEGRTTLSLAGDLDAAATDALRGLLICVERLPNTVHVEADGVLGADLDAFDPLLDVARTRHARGLPGVFVESLSDAVREVFERLSLSTQLPVELGLP